MAATQQLSTYETDKSAQFLDNYDSEIGALGRAPRSILELGVQRGGSMYLWRDRFPSAEVAGLDVNEIPMTGDVTRIRVYRGYQQDPAVLDRIRSEVAPAEGFDVIIDDASHLGLYTAQSFWYLFSRHLRPGGLYVIEDWATGYDPQWSDGHRSSVPSHMPATATEGRPSYLERLRREVRLRARPIAQRVPSRARSRLEALYMRGEGLAVRRRFPSHDYGMVGVVKQIVDASIVDPGLQIESVKVVGGGQVFVRKASGGTKDASS